MSRTAPQAVAPVVLPEWTRTVLPARLKSPVRRALCAAVDAADGLRGERNALTPPAHLRVRVGCFLSYLRLSQYRAVAEEFAGYLRTHGRLRADSRVLDIGCGCGQLAVPLTGMLGGRGTYDGFDPDADAIAWCSARITPRFRNFRFAHADLANSQYNPGGRLHAASFRFPYEDGSFDLVVLKSVFTHLQGPAMWHYLTEIRRLLAPGGRTIASFMLLNDESSRCLERGESTMAFPFDGDGCRLLDEGTPEYKVAHYEPALVVAAASSGLTIESIDYGSWCGRPRFLSYQDLVVFSRPGEVAAGA